MTSSSGPSRGWGVVGAGTAAMAACAVCCAGPVLGGVGLASAFGAMWLPVLAVLAVASGLGVLTVRRRRRTAA
ncbi:hypothetical protein E4N62_19275 [Streptomyces sp. MNU76]|uniref:hypothetical protein n=1 Tax=Streptomyces sp. MNU76 TaxID=2560026 RepID=UPI001E37399B|nr:hypothetical protein [Streptomyces sp. MNU76]MCC9707226.1 hypothetical protein [Streptomyces sp. MNU76]